MRTKLKIEHPSKILNERFIKRHNMESKLILDTLGFSESNLNDFLDCKMSVSKELAVKLEKLTGVSSAYWLDRQEVYDLKKSNR